MTIEEDAVEIKQLVEHVYVKLREITQRNSEGTNLRIVESSTAITIIVFVSELLDLHMKQLADLYKHTQKEQKKKKSGIAG